MEDIVIQNMESAPEYIMERSHSILEFYKDIVIKRFGSGPRSAHLNAQWLEVYDSYYQQYKTVPKVYAASPDCIIMERIHNVGSLEVTRATPISSMPLRSTDFYTPSHEAVLQINHLVNTMITFSITHQVSFYHQDLTARNILTMPITQVPTPADGVEDFCIKNKVILVDLESFVCEDKNVSDSRLWQLPLAQHTLTNNIISYLSRSFKGMLDCIDEDVGEAKKVARVESEREKVQELRAMKTLMEEKGKASIRKIVIKRVLGPSLYKQYFGDA